MTITRTEKTAHIIESRFIDFILSDKFAQSRLGLETEPQVHKTGRELLEIETKAIEAKQKQEKTEREFKVYVNEYFHDALFEYLDEKVNNDDYLFGELIAIEPAIPELLDACIAKAASAQKLEALIQRTPWLTRHLLHLVNNPPFRDPKSKKSFVDKVGLAIRYIGIDNAKIPVLTYIAKNLLPHSTEPFTEFKTNYWQYSLSTANCMKQLARHYQIDEKLAYLFGLLHGIGISTTLRLYLRAFDTVRISQMKKVLKANRRDLEKVLHTLEVDPTFVSEALAKYSPLITHKLMVYLRLNYAVLAPYTEELLNNIQFENSSSMTRALTQAKAYAKYKMLQKARLVELDEAKMFLTFNRINNDVMTELNQVDLLKVSLKSD